MAFFLAIAFFVPVATIAVADQVSRGRPDIAREVSPFPGTAKLGKVFVAKRRIFKVFGSPNHWAVLIEVPGYGYINVQFNTDEDVSWASSTSSHNSNVSNSSNSSFGPGPSRITVTYHPSFRDAALRTSGYETCDIRTSTYERATHIATVQELEDVVQLQRNGRFHCNSYVLGTNDCQNYARDLVERLNSKWVGLYPFEDGPDISYD